MKKKFTFIDLFAGIGGIRIPFDELGGNCVFTSEFDKFAQQTYEANFGETPSGDITLINEKDIPKHDLLLAGFPCQAFSNAGLRKGFNDTRGTLFFDIVRGHDQGRTFKTIISVINEIGYQTIESEVLNARDFGLPQNRERIFIVGFWKHKNFQFPIPPKTPTRLGSILKKRVQDRYTISDKLWASTQLRKKRAQQKGYGFGFSLFNRESKYTSTMSARYY